MNIYVWTYIFSIFALNIQLNHKQIFLYILWREI